MKRRTLVLLAILAATTAGAVFSGMQQEGGLAATPGKIVARVTSLFGGGTVPAPVPAEAAPLPQIHAAVAHPVPPAEPVPEAEEALQDPLDDGATGFDATGVPAAGSIPESYAVTLTGRVVLAGDETPVEGVTVVANFVDDEPGWEGQLEAETAADGSFSIGLEEARRLVGFEVLAGPETTPIHDKTMDLWVREGEDPGVTLIVTPGASVEGVVLDPEGQPMSGAEVFAWCRTPGQVDVPAMPDPDRFTVSDENGHFSIPAVGPEFVIGARAQGYALAGRWIGRADAGQDFTDVTLRFTYESECTGIVTGLDGEPLQGARFKAVPLRDWFENGAGPSAGIHAAGPGAAFSSTDQEGKFYLGPLDDEPYVIEASAENLPRWRSLFLPGDDTMDIDWSQGAQLTGRVIAPDGAPISGAEVLVFDNYWRWAGTGADGRFEILGLTPGLEARVHVTAPGFALTVEPPFMMETGEPIHKEFSLEPGWEIAGRAVDAQGTPVEGAEVAIHGDRFVSPHEYPRRTWEESIQRDRTTTGADGSFRFTSLYLGDYEVTVHDPQDPRLQVRQASQAGDTALEIRLDPVAMRKVALVGHVRDGDTKEPIGTFSVIPVAPAPAGAEADAHDFQSGIGAFEIVGLEPGNYQLTILAEGYAPQTIPARFYEIGDHPFDVLLLPERDLAMRVVDQNGEAVPGARLRFQDASGHALMVPVGRGMHATSLTADAEGRAVTSGLPAGHIRAFVEVPHQAAPFEFDFDLEAPVGDEQQLSVILTAPVPVLRTGIVLYGAELGFQVVPPHGGVTGAWLEEIESTGKVWHLDAPALLTVRRDRDGEVIAKGRLAPQAGGTGYTWECNDESGGATVPVIWSNIPAERLSFEVRAEGYAPSFLGQSFLGEEGGQTVAFFLIRSSVEHTGAAQPVTTGTEPSGSESTRHPAGK